MQSAFSVSPVTSISNIVDSMLFAAFKSISKLSIYVQIVALLCGSSVASVFSFFLLSRLPSLDIFVAGPLITIQNASVHLTQNSGAVK